MQKRTVLLFRAAKCPDAYEAALKQADCTPYFIPVLQFKFVNQKPLSAALLNSSTYSGVIFTSQTAVEASLAALSESVEVDSTTPSSLEAPIEQVTEQWKTLPVFVVGRATATAVNRLGLKAFGGHTGNAESLSQVIIEYFNSRKVDRHTPLLFPCSSIKRETLPSSLQQAGLALEVLVSYTTQPHPDILSNISSILDRLSAGDVVYAVFFSPSGIDYSLETFVRECEMKKIGTKLVAIGPTTAEALSNAGHPPSVSARKPTPDSLVEAISTIA